jgi:hypothetical protein
MREYTDIFYPLLIQPRCALSSTDISKDVHNLSVMGNTDDFPTIERFENLHGLMIEKLSVKYAPILSKLSRVESLILRQYNREDFSSLKGLKKLKHLMIWQSPKVRSLNGLQGLSLESLILQEAGIMIDLRPLETLRKLKSLKICGGIFKEATVKSLVPLLNIRSLKWLELAAVKVPNNDLSPLTKLSGIEYFNISTGYPLDQLAPIAAHFPHLLAEWLQPQGDSGITCKKCKRENLKWLAGKGTRMVCAKCDAKRIASFQVAFKEMVKKSSSSNGAHRI